MTLRIRTALAIIIGCAVVAIIFFFTMQGILSARFTSLERQKANQDLQRASNALNQNIATLKMAVGDWAVWDDTYSFVQDGNDTYIASNLETSTLANLGINFIVFVNPAGQVVYSKAVDLTNKAEVALPAGLDQYVTGEAPLARHDSETSSIAGILVLSECPVFVASQPILTSRSEGPIAGSLIMGRFLDSQELQKLSEFTALSLELHRTDESDLPADFETAGGLLSEEETTLVRVLDKQTIAAYMLLNDINGNPTAVLRIDEPRDIYAQGQHTARYVLLLLLGLGTVFSVCFVFWIDRLVLSRLRRLSSNVEKLGTTRSLSERLPVDGKKDELAAVAEAINRTLASLEQAQRDLMESEAKNRALLDAIPDLMLRMNRDGRILETRRPQEAKSSDGSGHLHHASIPDELINLLPTDIRQMAVPYVQKALESRRMQVFEFQLMLGDQISHYEARVLAGSEDEALVMVRDITERKHEEEARQKSLLLKEIHHRVKNNLQVISGLLYLQARRTDDKRVMEMLNESNNRVKSVALIHQRLYQSRDKVSVNLSEYVRDLTAVLLHSRDRDAALVKLDLDLESNLAIGLDSAVPCGLIVNELVSNSLKHAFPEGRQGEIFISLHSDDTDNLTIVVGDNGIGLPEGVDFRKTETLGLQLVVTLVDQLGGSVEVEARGGTRYTIRFKEQVVRDDDSPAPEICGVVSVA